MIGLLLRHHLQAHRQRQQGLAGARLAQHGHQLDIRAQQQLERYMLFQVQGTQAPGMGLFVQQFLDAIGVGAPNAQGRLLGIGGVLEHDAFVGQELVIHLDLFAGVEAVDILGAALDFRQAVVELIVVHGTAQQVFRANAQGVALDTGVDVLGDKGDIDLVV
jgi:hypothetical protein